MGFIFKKLKIGKNVKWFTTLGDNIRLSVMRWGKTNYGDM